MEGEVEVEIVFYITTKIIKSVKVPISELEQDDEGMYDYDEIEKLAAIKGKDQLTADGVRYVHIDFSESELISCPEGFDYYI